MPHIIVEYSSNIADQIAVPELLRKLHGSVVDHGVDAFKIKARGVELTDYIVGDGETAVSMIHVNCLLLAGRPAPFAAGLSTDLLAVVQTHIAEKSLDKCSPSVEVRDMDADLYSK